MLSTKCKLWVNGLVEACFPTCCLFCGGQLPVGSHCCGDCMVSIRPVGRHVCRRCGVPMGESTAPGPCGRCLKKAPAQASTRHLYCYDGAVREAILAWKLQRDDAALRWLVGTAGPVLREIFSCDDLLLPVPMPLGRMRKSGVHHAAELCKLIAEQCGCRWDWHMLRRIGEQPRQSALSGRERRRNLCKAFRLSSDYEVSIPSAGRLWVVDDVFTTGSTLHYAAQAAGKSGQPVHAFALARVAKE